MDSVKEYAKIISKADPMFVEVKAYMWVGSSRERLEKSNMPTHSEIREFSEKLAEKLAWKIIDEQKESRVVLLMKEDYSGRVMKFD